MKKIMTVLMLALPLTACENNQELKLENARLVQENQDLKVKVARLEERAKPASAVTSAVATPVKAKAKSKVAATKVPEEASAAEKEALVQAATGGGSFK